MICFFSVSICVVYIAVFVNYYVKLIKFVHVNSLNRDAIGLDILLFFVLANMNVDFNFYRLFIIPSWNINA